MAIIQTLQVQDANTFIIVTRRAPIPENAVEIQFSIRWLLDAKLKMTSIAVSINSFLFVSYSI